jgi:tetratricopeptide (TPR) repeat protein
VLLYNLGDLAGAERELVEYSALLGGAGSLRDEARVTFQLGLVKYHIGELAEAERLGIQARDWLERTGETYFQLQNLRTLALCAVARGELDVAEERLRQASAIAAELGGWLAVEIDRCLVDVLLRQGRVGDARELGDAAAQNLPEEDAYARAACLLIEANLTTAESRHTDARDCFGEALRLLEQQRLPLDVAEARLAYGRALRRLEDEEGAVAELERARAQLAALGAPGLVAEAERELAELREGATEGSPLTRTRA